MSHPMQNWKCKCGRGPSIEHSVGGYCSGREVIESLESQLRAADELLEAVKGMRWAQGREMNKAFQRIEMATVAYEKARGKE